MCGGPHREPFGDLAFDADLFEDERPCHAAEDADEDHDDGREGRDAARLCRDVQRNGGGDRFGFERCDDGLFGAHCAGDQRDAQDAHRAACDDCRDDRDHIALNL